MTTIIVFYSLDYTARVIDLRDVVQRLDDLRYYICKLLKNNGRTVRAEERAKGEGH